MSRHTPLQHIALTLHRATALVDRVADAYLQSAHGIGISIFAAMVTVNAIGPARQSAIARGLGVSRAAVTQRLAEPVARGLIEVVPDAADRRANLVVLSAAGKKLLSEAWEGLERSDDGVEEGVDLGSLQIALETLIANAERHLATKAPQ